MVPQEDKNQHKSLCPRNIHHYKQNTNFFDSQSMLNTQVHNLCIIQIVQMYDQDMIIDTKCRINSKIQGQWGKSNHIP